MEKINNFINYVLSENNLPIEHYDLLSNILTKHQTTDLFKTLKQENQFLFLQKLILLIEKTETKKIKTNFDPIFHQFLLLKSNANTEIFMYIYTQIELIKKKVIFEEYEILKSLKKMTILKKVIIDSIEQLPFIISFLLKVANFEYGRLKEMIESSINLLRIIQTKLFLFFGDLFKNEIEIAKIKLLVKEKSSTSSLFDFINHYLQIIIDFGEIEHDLRQTTQYLYYQFFSELAFYSITYLSSYGDMILRIYDILFRYFTNIITLDNVNNYFLMFFLHRRNLNQLSIKTYFLDKLIQYNKRFLTFEVFSTKHLKEYYSVLIIAKIFNVSNNNDSFIFDLFKKLNFNFSDQKTKKVKEESCFFSSKNYRIKKVDYKKTKKLIFEKIIDTIFSFSNFFDFDSEKQKWMLKICQFYFKKQGKNMISQIYVFFHEFIDFVDSNEKLLFIDYFDSIFGKFYDRSNFINFFLTLVQLILLFSQSKSNIRQTKQSDMIFLIRFFISFDMKALIHKLLFDFSDIQKNEISVIYDQMRLIIILSIAPFVQIDKYELISKVIYILFENLVKIQELSIFDVFCFYLIHNQLERSNKKSCIYICREILSKYKQRFLTLAQNAIISSSEKSTIYFINYLQTFSITKKKVDQPNAIEIFRFLSKIVLNYEYSNSSRFFDLTKILHQIVFYFTSNRSIYESLCRIMKTSKNQFLNPPNILRKTFLLLFSFAKNNNFKAAISVLQLLNTSVDLLFNVKMLKEQNSEFLSENDDPNVSIPNTLGSLLFEVKVSIHVYFYGFIFLILKENEVFVNFFQSFVGSNKEKNTRKKLKEFILLKSPDFETKFYEIDYFLEKTKFSYNQFQVLSGQDFGTMFRTFYETVRLLYLSVKKNKIVLSSCFDDFSIDQSQKEKKTFDSDLEANKILNKNLENRENVKNKKLCFEEFILLFFLFCQTNKDNLWNKLYEMIFDILKISELKLTFELGMEILMKDGVDLLEESEYEVLDFDD